MSKKRRKSASAIAEKFSVFEQGRPARGTAGSCGAPSLAVRTVRTEKSHTCLAQRRLPLCAPMGDGCSEAPAMASHRLASWRAIPVETTTFNHVAPFSWVFPLDVFCGHTRVGHEGFLEHGLCGVVELGPPHVFELVRIEPCVALGQAFVHGEDALG